MGRGEREGGDETESKIKKKVNIFPLFDILKAESLLFNEFCQNRMKIDERTLD